MRSLIVANALKKRWPDITIHFILNEQVSYIKDCPHLVHTCVGSPTKDVDNVQKIINDVNPDLVIFDASGRGSQFKQAKAIGAKVAFISQHKKKRNRGLKLNRLLHTDIHWVVQPGYCINKISAWHKAKLFLLNKHAPKNVGPVFEISDTEYQHTLLQHLALTAQGYVVFNAGSGGHKIKGNLASDIYFQAAKAFNRKTAIKCVIIFGSNYPQRLPEDPSSEIVCIKTIGNKDFMSLINGAKGCVVSAGDTLLQCIALHKPCVASSVSPDQPTRLKRCSNKHLVMAAEPSSDNLVKQAVHLFVREDKEKQVLLTNMKNQAPIKALEIIVNDIAALFDSDKQSITKKNIYKDST